MVRIRTDNHPTRSPDSTLPEEESQSFSFPSSAPDGNRILRCVDRPFVPSFVVVSVDPIPPIVHAPQRQTFRGRGGSDWGSSLRVRGWSFGPNGVGNKDGFDRPWERDRKGSDRGSNHPHEVKENASNTIIRSRPHSFLLGKRKGTRALAWILSRRHGEHGAFAFLRVGRRFEGSSAKVGWC